MPQQLRRSCRDADYGDNEPLEAALLRSEAATRNCDRRRARAVGYYDSVRKRFSQ